MAWTAEALRTELAHLQTVLARLIEAAMPFCDAANVDMTAAMERVVATLEDALADARDAAQRSPSEGPATVSVAYVSPEIGALVVRGPQGELCRVRAGREDLAALVAQLEALLAHMRWG